MKHWKKKKERTHQLVNRETRTPYNKSTTPSSLQSPPPSSSSYPGEEEEGGPSYLKTGKSFKEWKGVEYRVR